MSRQFKKVVENFTCEKCLATVTGNGFTNHCPKCLYSKHVDLHPGDRAAGCGGTMVPIDVFAKGSSYVVVHECTVCKHTKPNKISPQDSFDVVVALSAKKP